MFREYYYCLSMAEREIFAKSAKTKTSYLNQIAGGFRSPGSDLSVRLSKESGVPLKRLFPDRYGEAA
jgi:hypothetical protein